MDTHIGFFDEYLAWFLRAGRDNPREICCTCDVVEKWVGWTKTGTGKIHGQGLSLGRLFEYISQTVI